MTFTKTGDNIFIITFDHYSWCHETLFMLQHSVTIWAQVWVQQFKEIVEWTHIMRKAMKFIRNTNQTGIIQEQHWMLIWTV